MENVYDNKIRIEFDVGSYNRNLIDFLTMLEISNRSTASEDDIKQLSDEITSNWRIKNKNRFLDENSN